MKIGTILKAINRHAAIYVCLAVFFAFCWFIHHLALLTMEMLPQAIRRDERRDAAGDGPD